MKKLLGIVVLGLLLSGCTVPKLEYENKTGGQLTSHFTTKSYQSIKYRADINCKKYNSNAIATNIVERYEGGAFHLGEGGEYSIYTYKCGIEKKVIAQQPTKQDIEPFKATCRNIGYTDGSEKFSDCVKDLYLKNLDSQNQSQSTTIVKSKSKRKIDPSVWDDLLNVSKGMSEGKSVTESLGGVSSSSSSSKVQCFKSGERVSGTNKICSYNCMGSEVTTNVASTRICPMSIDLN